MPPTQNATTARGQDLRTPARTDGRVVPPPPARSQNFGRVGIFVFLVVFFCLLKQHRRNATGEGTLPLAVCRLLRRAVLDVSVSHHECEALFLPCFFDTGWDRVGGTRTLGGTLAPAPVPPRHAGAILYVRCCSRVLHPRHTTLLSCPPLALAACACVPTLHLGRPARRRQRPHRTRWTPPPPASTSHPAWSTVATAKTSSPLRRGW